MAGEQLHEVWIELPPGPLLEHPLGLRRAPEPMCDLDDLRNVHEARHGRNGIATDSTRNASTVEALVHLIECFDDGKPGPALETEHARYLAVANGNGLGCSRVGH